MEVLFVASVAVVTTDPRADVRLLADVLGLPLRAPITVPGSDYRYSEEVPGSRHLGVWPLREAARSCFGQDEWPPGRPVPQASLELEVADVDRAAAELAAAGVALLHPPRTEPWGQRLARFQAADGMLLAVCRTPHLAGG